jgi:hypothetical protein
MKSLGQPGALAHPNLGDTSSHGLAGAYDVVVATSQNVITPQGTKTRVRVYSRVRPEQIASDTSGRLAKGASKARKRIDQAIDKLKVKPELKRRLHNLMSAQIKGNITESSRQHTAADAFHQFNEQRLHLPEKMVRFVDAPPAEIPRAKVQTPAMPTEVILPALPPDD